MESGWLGVTPVPSPGCPLESLLHSVFLGPQARAPRALPSVPSWTTQPGTPLRTLRAMPSRRPPALVPRDTGQAAGLSPSRGTLPTWRHREAAQVGEWARWQMGVTGRPGSFGPSYPSTFALNSEHRQDPGFWAHR